MQQLVLRLLTLQKQNLFFHQRDTTMIPVHRINLPITVAIGPWIIMSRVLRENITILCTIEIGQNGYKS